MEKRTTKVRVDPQLRDWFRRQQYPADLKPHGIAWEFLRRNPIYRSDWTTYEATSDKSLKLQLAEKWSFWRAALLDPRIPATKDLLEVFDDGIGIKAYARGSGYDLKLGPTEVEIVFD